MRILLQPLWKNPALISNNFLQYRWKELHLLECCSLQSESLDFIKRNQFHYFVNEVQKWFSIFLDTSQIEFSTGTSLEEFLASTAPATHSKPIKICSPCKKRTSFDCSVVELVSSTFAEESAEIWNFSSDSEVTRQRLQMSRKWIELRDEI